MITIKLFLMVLCAGLFFLGGYSFLAARRYMMPFVLGIGIGWFSGVWWLGLAISPVCGALCLGYGDKSVLKHIAGDAWARFIWMALAAFIISIGSFINGNISIFLMVTYVSISGILGITFRNINQILGDIIFGTWLSSIVFFVHQKIIPLS